MAAPLERVVQSYKRRSRTIEDIPHLVRLEAAVQGWYDIAAIQPHAINVLPDERFPLTKFG